MTTNTPTKRKATPADLYVIPENGKAEIVRGEIVTMSPAGAMPGCAGGEIYFSLRLYEQMLRDTEGGNASRGHAFPDNVGFVVNLPERESFSPDAAWYVGDVGSMKFLKGAPVFAVEVRSENDYGAQAEIAMAAKRADYFSAGTLVVWDVDLQSADVIRKFTGNDPANPTVFRRGEIAEAEPAVPDWTLDVNVLFV